MSYMYRYIRANLMGNMMRIDVQQYSDAVPETRRDNLFAVGVSIHIIGPEAS